MMTMIYESRGKVLAHHQQRGSVRLCMQPRLKQEKQPQTLSLQELQHALKGYDFQPLLSSLGH